MAEFAWEARGRTGELRKGTMEADNEEAVNTRLRQQQLNPVKVKKKPLAISFQIGTGVDTKDLVTFTRLFATMIDAGLPLVQCLDILANQQPKQALRDVLKDIKNAVEGGSTFSDALRRHPKIFDELFVNLVQAGEVGGILDTILNRLAVYIEKRQKLDAPGPRRAGLSDRRHRDRDRRHGRAAHLRHPGVREHVRGVRRRKDELPALTRFMVALSHGFVSYLPHHDRRRHRRAPSASRTR